jgi:hypothetical protein
MKKFLAIFLVLTLLFAFAACNKGDDTNTDDNTTTESQVGEQITNVEESTTKKKSERFETTTAAPFENPNILEPAKLFKLVDVNSYSSKSADPNTTKSSGVTFIMNRYEKKISSGNTLSAGISTEGTSFVINETVLRDFVANGWNIRGNKDANTAIEAGDEVSVILENSQGKITRLMVTNKASTSMALADCVITEVSVLKTIEGQNWADFTIDDKVGTAGLSSYADFINAFGEPKTINAIEYYKGNDYTHSKVTLIFEQKIGNETRTVSVAYNDKATGEIELESCVYRVK